MKRKRLFQVVISFASVLLILAITGCSEKSSVTAPVQSNNLTLDKHGFEPKFKQVNLVADFPAEGARIDPNLGNAWGIAVSPTGIFWISANHTSLTTIYDASGAQKLAPVGIPTSGGAPGGAPTGTVFNSTTVFNLPGGNASRFIFVGEDGIVSAWGPSAGSMAVGMADQSAQEAVYKGVDIAMNNGNPFLYAANFKQQKVDVFDGNFNLVSMGSTAFQDPNLPEGYGPFNIKNIGGMLYVTFAKRLAPDFEDDEKGPGNGYVDIFTPAGQLVRRFATRGTLNSPWGIAEGNDGKLDNTILIGNFGDGRINVFKTSGEFLGQLRGKMDKPITIDGLWALYTSDSNSMISHRIYFTAGPNDEENGLFGYLVRKDGMHNGNDDVADTHATEE